jgi:hypothetical protein
MQVKVRHLLVRRRAVVGENAVAAFGDTFRFRDFEIARRKAASSASDARSEKSSIDTYSPFGISTTCVGACGLMSRKASTCSSSYTFVQGSSPRKIRAKTFLRS